MTLEEAVRSGKPFRIISEHPTRFYTSVEDYVRSQSLTNLKFLAEWEVLETIEISKEQLLNAITEYWMPSSAISKSEFSKNVARELGFNSK